MPIKLPHLHASTTACVLRKCVCVWGGGGGRGGEAYYTLSSLNFSLLMPGNKRKPRSLVVILLYSVMDHEVIGAFA